MKTKFILTIITITGILLFSCSDMSQIQEDRKKRIQTSPQYKDGSFSNPIEVPMIAPGSTWELIKKYTIISRVDPRPAGLLPVEHFRSEDWIDPDKEGPFDITFLKIGSYDETWKQIHMTPEEAVRQHQYLRGRVLTPLHWATFDLGLHPWYEPIERLLTAAGKEEVQFIVPKIGQRIDTSRLPEADLWWRSVDKHQKRRGFKP